MFNACAFVGALYPNMFEFCMHFAFIEVIQSSSSEAEEEEEGERKVQSAK